MKTFESRKYKPTGWRLIVKPDSVKTETQSGIVLAMDEERESRAVTIGTVVSIGEACWYDTKAFERTGDWCKEGDRVVFAKYAGGWLDDGSKEGLMILNDEDVEAIITEEVPL